MAAQKILLSACLFCGVAAANATAKHTFLSIGDWGGKSIERLVHNVEVVSAAMEKVASQVDPQFVVNTGDNFYWCGITTTADKQVSTDWLESYTGALGGLTWYSSLGNHEYGYNVTAQIALGDVHDRWVMDARYYTRRVEIGMTGTYMTLIVLDTTPCTKSYRGTNPKEWDPCSSEFPTCSLENTDDDFEGKCQFHNNVVGQSCDAQYAWLQKTLKTVPADDWLFIVGHSPADDIDVLDFATVMQNHGFDLYLNGHVHTLTQYTLDGKGAYVTTGAGSMVKTPDQDQGSVPAKLMGEDLDAARGGGHSYQTQFNTKTAGFTLHTFSDDLRSLTTDFYDYTGKALHSFTVDKRRA